MPKNKIKKLEPSGLPQHMSQSNAIHVLRDNPELLVAAGTGFVVAGLVMIALQQSAAGQ